MAINGNKQRYYFAPNTKKAPLLLEGPFQIYEIEFSLILSALFWRQLTLPQAKPAVPSA